MKKNFKLKAFLCITAVLLVFSCSQEIIKSSAGAEKNVTFTVNNRSVTLESETTILDITGEEALLSTAGAVSQGTEAKSLFNVVLVKLSGRVQHFGFDISQTPPAPFDFFLNEPGVNVWVDEYPITKELNIQSNAEGVWTLWILKCADSDIEFSYIYEKEGWITTKSAVIPVTDEDNTDIAIQFINPFYFNYGVKPTIEQQLGAALGFPVTLNNALVVTVGKSWSTMFEMILPHGDPGAIATVSPAVPFPATIGPIYFNEQIQPDPVLTSTSVDGGVTWINMPVGTFNISAEKEGVEYKSPRFKITETDAANGVVLYIASPPDSVEGSNDSAPGQW